MDEQNIVRIHTACASRREDMPAGDATVEVSVSEGIGIHLVGIRDAEMKESLLTVTTALQSCGYSLPGKKIVINVRGGYTAKNTYLFDLPIAVGILLASGQITVESVNIDDHLFIGELNPDGSIFNKGKTMHSVIKRVSRLSAIETDDVRIVNALQEDIATLVEVYPFGTLREVVSYLEGHKFESSSYLVYGKVASACAFMNASCFIGSML